MLDALLAAGFNVQLKHDADENPAGQQATGWLKVLTAEGEVLAQHADYQHNRNYRNRYDLNDDMLSDIEDGIGAHLKPKVPPAFIETDFCTKVAYTAWCLEKFTYHKSVVSYSSNYA